MGLVGTESLGYGCYNIAHGVSGNLGIAHGYFVRDVGIEWSLVLPNVEAKDVVSANWILQRFVFGQTTKTLSLL